MSKGKVEKKAETDTAPEPRKFHPVDPHLVNKGDIMLFPYWAKVQSVSPSGLTLNANGLDGGLESFKVEGGDLVRMSRSADYYAEEIRVNRTEMGQILARSYEKPLTVVFDKKDGTERILRGRLLGIDTLWGRCDVEDLDQPVGDRFRQVDNRTLKSLTVDGVRYALKK